MGQASSSLDDMDFLQLDEMQRVSERLCQEENSLQGNGIWKVAFVQRILMQYQRIDLTQILPQECLAYVFSKLSVDDRNTCSLVCKRWHAVDAVTRSHLTLRARVDLSNDLPSILLRFEHITSLSLKWHRKSPSIDDDSLDIVGKNCKALLKLNLKGCKALTDEGLEHFSQACSSLQVFSCASCGFGARGLNSVLQHCSDLEDLSVKRLRSFIDNSKVIMPGGGKLRRLSLKDLFNAQLFGSLIVGSKYLQTLVLARNPGYWDRWFDLVVGNAKQLKELHCQSLQMGDEALQAISLCQKLQVLTLIKPSGCTDLGFFAMVNSCGSLMKLHVDDRKTGSFSDQGLFAVAESCLHLQELILIGVNVTAASLERIGSSCKCLERLVFCNSVAIGDKEILCVAENFNSLKKLCIKSCPISDYALVSLVTGCPNLTTVKMKNCKNVTQEAILWLQMSRTCLSVDRCDSLTFDEGETHHDGRETSRQVIRTPTTVTCSSRPSFLKNVATGNLLRRLPKSSCLPAAYCNGAIVFSQHSVKV